ncbi:Nn.00g063670.m01.CDS01 [Neocucurbitaria sp. VM-36]
MASTEPSRAELQTLAYEALSKYFQEHEDEVVEIEILPPAFEPSRGILMQEGLNLGVPKKILALAYVEGRQRFFKEMYDSSLASTVVQATKVMLLFDPEHLTAANFRKRWLLALRVELGSCNPAVYHKALQRELCFLNSILTSPLHRQSKSPTLWHHRAWLLGLLIPVAIETASKDEKATFWREELAAVCKSGEQHPKNYYAWQYARRVISRVESPGMTDDFARHVKDWCCKHPSDISGWSFLLFLIPRLQPMSLRQDLVRDILNYAINLRSEQESLWVFIRTTLAQEKWYGGLMSFNETLQTYSKDLEKNGKGAAVSEKVARTIDWIDTNREIIAISEVSIFNR